MDRAGSFIVTGQADSAGCRSERSAIDMLHLHRLDAAALDDGGVRTRHRCPPGRRGPGTGEWTGPGTGGDAPMRRAQGSAGNDAGAAGLSEWAGAGRAAC
jgi:hypothetical protein